MGQFRHAVTAVAASAATVFLLLHSGAAQSAADPFDPHVPNVGAGTVDLTVFSA